MANKRISPKEDPPVATTIYYPQSVKDQIDIYCAKIGKSISAVHRGWAKIHLDSPEAEIKELEKERLEHEAHIQSINAQITELEASDQRKQAAGQKREELIEEIVLKCSKGRNWSPKKGLIWEPEHKSSLKNRVKFANEKLNGDGEPIQVTEMIDMINQRFEAKKTGEVES